MNEPIKAPEPIKTAAPSTDQLAELLVKMSKLEAKIAEPQAVSKPLPVEIDWSKVTEAQVADLDFPIPVIEHELPDYMTIRLKDNNYVAKWVHTMPSHLGTMIASGYDYITKSDWDETYPNVLKFNAEGHLVYEDVIGLKVHKSRYFGKLRRENLKATQIRGIQGYGKVKGALNQAIQNDPRMESAINRGAMTFYGEQADARIEVNI